MQTADKTTHGAIYLRNAIQGFFVALASAAFMTGTPAFAYGPFLTPGSTYINSGDRIILNQTISNSAGSRIYLQKGEVRTRSSVREAKPYCYFEIYRSSAIIDTSATVEADEFEVHVTRNRVEYANVNRPLTQLAGRGFITQDASQQTLLTRIKITAPGQPAVTGLNCGIWAVPNERNHLSLKEILGALGDVVSLELHEGPA